MTRNSNQPRPLRRGDRGDARRQHPHGAALRAVPARHDPRARAAACGTLDGANIIDFLGEYTAGLYGHSHPVIRAALDRALDDGISFGAANMTEARFARAVCERFGLERVRFTNSGTEANLLAISLGRIFTAAQKVMVFNGGYHGAVFGFAAGGSPINVPFDYVVAPYNDIDSDPSADHRTRTSRW